MLRELSLQKYNCSHIFKISLVDNTIVEKIFFSFSLFEEDYGKKSVRIMSLDN